MNRAVCKIRKEPYYRRDAFERGLRTAGFTLHASLKVDELLDKTDWLVIWNRKRGLDETEALRWEQRGGTVIVAENGYLQQVDKTYYAISIGQHNGGGTFPVLDEDRFTKLGFPLLRWRGDSFDEVVLRLQRGIGSQLMASPGGWPAMASKIVAERWKGRARVIQHPGNFAPRVPPVQDLAQARYFVTWSSSMGVLALTLGVPVFYGAPRWICFEGAMPLDKFPLAREDYAARDKAMHSMSHGQWHFDEVGAGEPFIRIRDSL